MRKNPITTAKQNETDKPMDLANNDSLIKRQSMRGLNVQKINDKIGSKISQTLSLFSPWNKRARIHLLHSKEITEKVKIWYSFAASTTRYEKYMSRSFLHQLGKCFYAFFSSKCFKLVVHFPYRKFLLTSLEVVLKILQEISPPNLSESHVDNVSRMCHNGCGAWPMILTFPRFYHVMT